MTNERRQRWQPCELCRSTRLLTWKWLTCDQCRDQHEYLVCRHCPRRVWTCPDCTERKGKRLEAVTNQP